MYDTHTLTHTHYALGSHLLKSEALNFLLLKGFEIFIVCTCILVEAFYLLNRTGQF